MKLKEITILMEVKKMGKMKHPVLAGTLIVVLLLCVSTAMHQLYLFDEKYDNVLAELRAKQVRCRNILSQNLQNSPDLINLERTGADKNTFEISSQCYKLINDFDVVKRLKMKQFYINYITPYIFYIICGTLIGIIINGCIEEY